MVMGSEITEAIRQQAHSRIAEGDTCEHGNARGASSWDTPFCLDCETEEYNAACGEEEEVCCAICDGVGHGQPGYGPCPRYEVDYDLRHEVDEEERRAEMLRGPIWPDDIAF